MSIDISNPAPILAPPPATPPPIPTPMAPPVPQPAADFARPPVGAPGGPPIPPTIPLTVEEYQRLRGMERQLEDFQRVQAQAAAAAEAQRLKILADKEGAEKALESQKQAWEAKHQEAEARHALLQQQIYTERTTAVIDAALAGINFAGETPELRAATAAILRSQFTNDFEATRDASGVIVVREKVSGRPADQVLRERLALPQFAIFYAPATRGGSGSDGTRPPATPHIATPPTVLEESAARLKAQQGQYPSFGLRRIS